MSEHTDAVDTLIRCRKELVREIATAGAQGGIGRSQSYAASLVTVHNAIMIIEGLEVQSTTQADKMAAVRAAKLNK